LVLKKPVGDEVLGRLEVALGVGYEAHDFVAWERCGTRNQDGMQRSKRRRHPGTFLEIDDSLAELLANISRINPGDEVASGVKRVCEQLTSGHRDVDVARGGVTRRTDKTHAQELSSSGRNMRSMVCLLRPPTGI
jgi:hypothetical protein